MTIIVQKYGRKSVGSFERIQKLADRILLYRKKGQHLVVVLSPMGSTADALPELRKHYESMLDSSKLGMLLSTGEEVSAALLTMILSRNNCETIAMTGPQTSKRIDEQDGISKRFAIHLEKVKDSLQQGKVVILAGFQEATESREFTMERTDSTAIALAGELDADYCEIYSDEDGVYTPDPRIVPEAKKLTIISYLEMLELTRMGLTVLHPRSVETAWKYHIPVHIRSGDLAMSGTWIADHEPLEGEETLLKLTHLDNMAVIYVRGEGLQERIAKMATELYSANIPIYSLNRQTSEISFPVKTNLLDSVIEVLENHQDALQFESFTSINDVVKISIIGSRRESHAGILNQITPALQEQDISIIWVYKNIHRVSIAVSKQVAEKALQILHRELHERKDHATP